MCASAVGSSSLIHLYAWVTDFAKRASVHCEPTNTNEWWYLLRTSLQLIPIVQRSSEQMPSCRQHFRQRFFQCSIYSIECMSGGWSLKLRIQRTKQSTVWIWVSREYTEWVTNRVKIFNPFWKNRKSAGNQTPDLEMSDLTLNKGVWRVRKQPHIETHTMSSADSETDMVSVSCHVPVCQTDVIFQDQPL